ncbi:MAG: hypothetical protein PHX27_03075 [Candidatus ainarchaeum sp.]|nr:hypothetical protein [Candidatus ainarchaeum sp.]
MNKTIFLIIGLILIMPFFIGQENFSLNVQNKLNIENNIITNFEIDANTLRESRIIELSKDGANLRINQLKREIIRSMQGATEVIVINIDKGEDYNELKIIYEEMKLLKEQILELKKDSNNILVEFVTIKKELIDLVKEFKFNTQNNLTLNEKERIRNRLNDNNSLKQLNNQIKNQINNVNSQTIKTKLLDLNMIDDSNLISNSRTNEMNSKQIKQALTIKINAKISIKDNNMLNEKIMQNASKIINKKISIAEQINSKFKQTQKELTQKKIQNISGELKEKLEQKIMNKNKIVENIEQKLNKNNQRTIK